MRQLDKVSVTEAVIKLASGQRQDSWLAAGLIWGMIFCKGSAYSTALFYAGSVALAWLIARACQRIKAVKGVVKARV